MDVVVIGAGMAGLAAAHALVCGGREVVVLEARERIGGRLATDRRFAPVPVELGAELIHGGSVATWALVRAVGAEAYLMREGDNTGARAKRELEALECLLAGRSTEPAAEETAQDYLRRIGWSRPDWPVLELEVDSEPMDRSDAAGFLQLAEQELPPDAGENYRVPGGYDQLLRPLAEPAHMCLGAVVQQVTRSGTGVLVDYTLDGEQRTVSARTCVVTLPVGVLRAGTVTFVPRLPAGHVAAIEGLGAVDVAKLVYYFDHPVLPPRGDEIADLACIPPTFWNGSAGVAGFSGEIVVGWASGDRARELLRHGSLGALRAGLENLRLRVGDRGLRPVDMTMHDWSADPYSLGAYSYLRPGGAGAAAALAEPVDRTLFWAGEATNIAHPSTVHGAYESGIRAADEVQKVFAPR